MFFFHTALFSIIGMVTIWRYLADWEADIGISLILDVIGVVFLLGGALLFLADIESLFMRRRPKYVKIDTKPV